MRIILPGPFSQYRSFVSEEVPASVYRINMDSKLGGRMVRTALKTDRMRNWKIVEDTPSRYEATVFLGKSSNRLLMGSRRIRVSATQEDGQTEIKLQHANNATLMILVGLLFCVVPGLVLLITKVMHDGFERKVMSQVAAEIKASHPEAIVHED